MTAKRLKTGAVAYYWAPPTVDRKAGCPIDAEPLGDDYATAKPRADLLNKHLDAWRLRGAPVPDIARPDYGTVRWLFRTYFKSSAFQNNVAERSRDEYRRALARIEDIPTTIGDVVANLPVASITPAAVDKIYGKLQIGTRGQKRRRQANLSIDIARRAWDRVQRRYPDIVPAGNPWSGVERDLTKTPKAAATRSEAYALADALHAIGEPHLGVAALICFEWRQRPEHVRAGDITWVDWRPADHPVAVQIRHPKTGVKGWLPLEDDYGALYPELEAYLAALPRLGLPIVLTAGRRGPARPYSSEYAQRKVRVARNHAGLGNYVTLDACRHGGLTELGDAGATEAEVMSASMHKTPQAARLYVKRTETQRVSAARKRRNHVEGNKERQRFGMRVSE